MPEPFVDQGEYLSLDLIGTEYISQTIKNEYQEDVRFDGLFIGLIVENISNETCHWDSESLSVVDGSGFAYSIKYMDDAYHSLDELLPGGWYSRLDSLQSSRKYRYVIYLKDFHAELGLISYESDLISLIRSSDPDVYEEKEYLEIDVSNYPSEDIGGLPEIREALLN